VGIDKRALTQSVASKTILLLDTSAVIAYLDGGESVSPVSAHIIDSWVRTGRNTAVVSTITVMEVLVKPVKHQVGLAQARDFLTRFPNLVPQVVDMDVATRAAFLRAQYAFKPPDSLIIATGIAHGATALVTNDAQCSQKLASLQPGMSVLRLSDFT